MYEYFLALNDFLDETEQINYLRLVLRGLFVPCLLICLEISYQLHSLCNSEYKKRIEEGNVEKYIIKNFVIYTLRQMPLGYYVNGSRLTIPVACIVQAVITKGL
jgi:hypothetical protein